MKLNGWFLENGNQKEDVIGIFSVIYSMLMLDIEEEFGDAKFKSLQNSLSGGLEKIYFFMQKWTNFRDNNQSILFLISSYLKSRCKSTAYSAHDDQFFSI